MIAVELVAVVADEPILPTGAHARANCQPTRLEVDGWGVARLVYLPELAIVAVEFRDGSAQVIPIAHVWHMTVRPGVAVLEQLARAAA